jgi:hypothetical protein
MQHKGIAAKVGRTGEKATDVTATKAANSSSLRKTLAERFRGDSKTPLGSVNVCGFFWGDGVIGDGVIDDAGA